MSRNWAEANWRSRKRRVKCDEAKPYCRRCASARRQFEGYAKSIPAETSHQGLRIIWYTPFSGSWLERRCFEFFRVRTASWSDFSCRVLLAANDKPAIRHALIALSALQVEKRKLVNHLFVGLLQDSICGLHTCGLDLLYSFHLSRVSERSPQISRDPYQIRTSAVARIRKE